MAGFMLLCHYSFLSDVVDKSQFGRDAHTVDVPGHACLRRRARMPAHAAMMMIMIWQAHCSPWRAMASAVVSSADYHCLILGGGRRVIKSVTARYATLGLLLDDALPFAEEWRRNDCRFIILARLMNAYRLNATRSTFTRVRPRAAHVAKIRWWRDIA